MINELFKKASDIIYLIMSFSDERPVLHQDIPQHWKVPSVLEKRFSHSVVKAIDPDTGYLLLEDRYHPEPEPFLIGMPTRFLTEYLFASKGDLLACRQEVGPNMIEVSSNGANIRVYQGARKPGDFDYGSVHLSFDDTVAHSGLDIGAFDYFDFTLHPGVLLPEHFLPTSVKGTYFFAPPVLLSLQEETLHRPPRFFLAFANEGIEISGMSEEAADAEMQRWGIEEVTDENNKWVLKKDGNASYLVGVKMDKKHMQVQQEYVGDEISAKLTKVMRTIRKLPTPDFTDAVFSSSTFDPITGKFLGRWQDVHTQAGNPSLAYRGNVLQFLSEVRATQEE